MGNTLEMTVWLCTEKETEERERTVDNTKSQSHLVIKPSSAEGKTTDFLPVENEGPYFREAAFCIDQGSL